MIDFGALLFPNVAWATLVDRCERAEELGFRSLWVDDHGANPQAPKSNWFEAFATLAGLAGGLVVPLLSAYPSVGFTLTIKACAITILGGMGNLLGALVASLIIATIEVFSVLVIPSEWQNAIAFGTMILVLLVRPNGLFGKKQP